MVQLEAAVPVVVAAVVAVAVVASWPLVEDKMYSLPASAVHTSVDGNNVHVTGRDGGGREHKKHRSIFNINIRKGSNLQETFTSSARFCNKK